MKYRNDKISYKELFKSSKLFENYSFAYDDAWLKAYKNVKWEHLHKLPTRTIAHERFVLKV